MFNEILGKFKTAWSGLLASFNVKPGEKFNFMAWLRVYWMWLLLPLVVVGVYWFFFKKKRRRVRRRRVASMVRRTVSRKSVAAKKRMTSKAEFLRRMRLGKLRAKRNKK